MAVKKKPSKRAPKKPDLDQLLDFWATIVKVLDWKITIRYVRHLDDGEAAHCDYSLPYKEALISVLDPIDWQPKEPQDFDEAVVHELLHLHFAPFAAKPNTPEWIAEEQAVTCIARGFVALYRAKVAA